MTPSSVSRRDFVRVGLAAGGGLLVFGCGPKSGGSTAGTGSAAPFAPNPFIRLDPNGTVTIYAKHLEMGQGTYTGLSTLIVEEMDADWSKVVVEGATNDTEKYKNLAFGMMGTGGSSAIANSYDQHREAGAVARAALIAAAAKQWGVPVAELTTEPGEVVHAKSNRRAPYGTLAGAAATLPAPTNVAVKDPKDFRYIGKETGVRRTDAKDKSTGKAIFTQDVKLEGLLTAVVAHPPLYGAKVKSFDASKAKQVAGVTEVVQIPTGVAVLGVNFWAAKKGRDALTVEWDTSGANTAGVAEIMAEYRQTAATPGDQVRKDGDPAKAMGEAAKTVEATFEFPFLAHACMEPMNCAVQLKPNGAELWYGAQFQTPDTGAVAAVLGLKPEQVKINMLYAGGSFGRRANGKADFVVEAASIAKAINGSAPVKLVWTREDDTAAGYFRPAVLHKIKGGLDASGNPVAWEHTVVGPSITAGTPLDTPDGKDGSLHEGVSDAPYAIPNVFVGVHQAKGAVPVQWWRSVGHTHTAFAMEVFVDELARAAGKDPLEFRRGLLAKDPRRLAVLNLAAEKAGWGTAAPAGRARGIAVHKSFNTWVAEVAEVSMQGGRPKVHRVVCAVDCGVAVNPDVIRAQMESGIAYGLGAALYGQIAIDKGKVTSTNFDRYRVLRMTDMPAVEVHIVPSTEKPTGVGEPGLPPIAPAVANAVAALTGKSVRKLPLV